MTVDLQDGYEDIAASITTVIKLGVVGCNIEDLNQIGGIRSKEEAVKRISLAVQAASAAGVPEFAINARTDIMGHGGNIDDAIDRAKAYLDAGACTAFIWGGGGRGITTAEVEKAVAELNGRVSVMMSLAPGKLTVKELKKIGVARISIGPALQFKVASAFEMAAKTVLES